MMNLNGDICHNDKTSLSATHKIYIIYYIFLFLSQVVCLVFVNSHGFIIFSIPKEDLKDHLLLVIPYVKIIELIDIEGSRLVCYSNVIKG